MLYNWWEYLPWSARSMLWMNFPTVLRIDDLVSGCFFFITEFKVVFLLTRFVKSEWAASLAFLAAIFAFSIQENVCFSVSRTPWPCTVFSLALIGFCSCLEWGFVPIDTKAFEWTAKLIYCEYRFAYKCLVPRRFPSVFARDWLYTVRQYRYYFLTDWIFWFQMYWDGSWYC